MNTLAYLGTHFAISLSLPLSWLAPLWLLSPTSRPYLIRPLDVLVTALLLFPLLGKACSQYVKWRHLAATATLGRRIRRISASKLKERLTFGLLQFVLFGGLHVHPLLILVAYVREAPPAFGASHAAGGGEALPDGKLEALHRTVLGGLSKAPMGLHAFVAERNDSPDEGAALLDSLPRTRGGERRSARDAWLAAWAALGAAERERYAQSELAREEQFKEEKERREGPCRALLRSLARALAWPFRQLERCRWTYAAPDDIEAGASDSTRARPAQAVTMVKRKRKGGYVAAYAVLCGSLLTLTSLTVLGYFPSPLEWGGGGEVMVPLWLNIVLGLLAPLTLDPLFSNNSGVRMQARIRQLDAKLDAALAGSGASDSLASFSPPSSPTSADTSDDSGSSSSASASGGSRGVRIAPALQRSFSSPATAWAKDPHPLARVRPHTLKVAVPYYADNYEPF